ncbi:MAG: lipase family protein [Firmicutes bacterium]|nr:lipase family protein [Bacillota bacterium]
MNENEIVQVRYMPARLTYADMNRVDIFAPEPRPDGFGVSRAPFSPWLARLSAELSADVYDLNLAQWIKAGWADCTFVVEDRIVKLDRDTNSKLAVIENEWRRRRAMSLIQGVNPVGDLIRAARQTTVTDMDKSVVMTRPLADGRVVVAISFIGTTGKFFDWFSNFKIRIEKGMHAGFLELARRFHAHSGRILLPSAGEGMGKEALTLWDALVEGRKTDGRFVFWLSGHSQGGAVVQTYAHLLLEQGVLPEKILGITYAAPTVAALGGALEPKQYPIYNLVNTDDVVPRVGAQVRLGVDCVFFPDDAFRTAHYQVEAEMRPAFDRMLALLKQVQTTRDACAFALMLARMLERSSTDESMEGLFAELIPHMAILKRMGLSFHDIARYFVEKLTEYNMEMTGWEPDEKQCAGYEAMFRAVAGEFGAKEAAGALTLSLRAAHGIRPDRKGPQVVPPYIAIARKHLGELEQGVWQADAPPRCLTEKGDQMLPQLGNNGYIV